MPRNRVSPRNSVSLYDFALLFDMSQKLKVGTVGWSRIGEGELSLMFVLLEGLKNLMVTILTLVD